MAYDKNEGTWSAAFGDAFDVTAGEGYQLYAGGGLAETLTLRFTGYVPDEALAVPVAKPSWTQTERWVAYGMPRSRTLDTLGLREACSDWYANNTLRLRPLGSRS